MKPKNTICLWFDKDAEDAARFYARTFPNSEVTAVHRAPGDYPGGKAGAVLTVDFTVCGIPCIGLNGGPEFTHSEAFSFQIATDNQEETDRYWNAIVGNGGQESQCGWCKDRWGLSWQITPRALTDAMAAGGAEAKRVRGDDADEEDRHRHHRTGAAGLKKLMIFGPNSGSVRAWVEPRLLNSERFDTCGICFYLHWPALRRLLSTEHLAWASDRRAPAFCWASASPR